MNLLLWSTIIQKFEHFSTFVDIMLPDFVLMEVKGVPTSNLMSVRKKNWQILFLAILQPFLAIFCQLLTYTYIFHKFMQSKFRPKTNKTIKGHTIKIWNHYSLKSNPKNTVYKNYVLCSGVWRFHMPW